MEQLPGSQIIGTFEFQVYTHCQSLIHRRKCYIQLVNGYLMLSTVTTCSIYRIISKTTTLNQYTRITWEQIPSTRRFLALIWGMFIQSVSYLLAWVTPAAFLNFTMKISCLSAFAEEKTTLSHNQSQAVHLYNWRLGGVELAFSCERITCYSSSKKSLASGGCWQSDWIGSHIETSCPVGRHPSILLAHLCRKLRLVWLKCLWIRSLLHYLLLGSVVISGYIYI